jgi:hypothetical protein
MTTSNARSEQMATIFVFVLVTYPNLRHLSHTQSVKNPAKHRVASNKSSSHPVVLHGAELSEELVCGGGGGALALALLEQIECAVADEVEVQSVHGLCVGVDEDGLVLTRRNKRS